MPAAAPTMSNPKMTFRAVTLQEIVSNMAPNSTAEMMTTPALEMVKTTPMQAKPMAAALLILSARQGCAN